MKTTIPLNNNLKTAEERTAYVTEICEKATPEQLTAANLTILADYILEALPKKERLQHNITTKNRAKHISKRETSYQGLSEKLEGGEDTLFNFLSGERGGKEQYLDPKKEADPFPQELLDKSPELQSLRESIKQIENAAMEATGRRKFLLRQQVIEMRQDQYVIRASLVSPIRCTSITRSFSQLDLTEHITVTDAGNVISDGICSLYTPKHVAAVLANYDTLLATTHGKFNSDSWYFMMDFKKLFEQDYAAAAPMLYDLARMKIDGFSNLQIQQELKRKYNVTHSLEYISTLWTTKIPAAIADLAEEQYLNWYYTFKEKGKYKKCNRCGQIKLALPRYFSKNKSSKDGFYSICKDCRSTKNKEKNK